MAKYPNVKIERIAKSFEDLLKTVKLAASGPNAPDVVQANQGRGDHGRDGQGQAAPPGRATTRRSMAGTTATRRRCWRSTRSRPTASEFGSGDLYGLSQSGEIVGVFYNKDKVATPPTTLDEFEASLQKAKDAGETPIMFGNLEKWPGIHNFESRARADRRQAGDPRLRLRQGGRVVRQPGVHRRRHEDQGLGRQGLLQQGLQRHRLRPRVAVVREGQGPVPDRGHVARRRPRQADGRQGRLHADARQGPQRPGVARRRGPAVVDHLVGQEPRRRGGLHRLPHRRQRGQGAGRHGQPAGDEGRAGAGGRRCRWTSPTPGRSSTRPTA